MFDRFTDGAKRAMSAARHAALGLRHAGIDTVHLVLGLLGRPDQELAAELERLHVDVAALRGEIEGGAAPGTAAVAASAELPFTARAKHALMETMVLAAAAGKEAIATVHVLWGCMASADGELRATLRRHGFRDEILAAMKQRKAPAAGSAVSAWLAIKGAREELANVAAAAGTDGDPQVLTVLRDLLAAFDRALEQLRGDGPR